ncbi:PREDICTED: mismatch repair endonuclease PMS2-like [Priapulus caudatus]|uniref:Mismatch repair endonuclease PMS2-like n=1 Tax=Priapulus caudatus TaxID=37621 RepID=A0ABM1E0Z5_PRICU|nr:PREDICTED: mismatch repair endonuclease PMS2-like [Priapulus caudatus]
MDVSIPGLTTQVCERLGDLCPDENKCSESREEIHSSDSGFCRKLANLAVPADSNVSTTGSISVIDKNSVHRICSGQVILTLATAVKELIENSIDAGACVIEVRLKDYGSKLIEVIDNGCGVSDLNFQGLTLKHHTSKLKAFSELVGVETFGFRGEALSSLCALSDVVITTCHESSAIGSKLTYGHGGDILGNIPCPRQKGTTVSVAEIFSTLPVRHREFTKNVRREFTKMVSVLNAYCVISTGIRLSCSNQVGKGKKTIVVATSGNGSTRENIADVFGPKQLNSLVELIEIPPGDEILAEYGFAAKDLTAKKFSISGYVSDCTHGEGRSTTDRQFVFINGRPCNLPNVTKILNDVYHMYNRYQYPACVLNISSAKEMVDVNVTPDKRQVFVQNERLLQAALKATLLCVFHDRSFSIPTSGTTLQQKITNAKMSSVQGSVMGDKVSCSGFLPERPSVASLKRSFGQWHSSGALPTEQQVSKQRRIDSFLNESITAAGAKFSDASHTKGNHGDDKKMVDGTYSGIQVHDEDGRGVADAVSGGRHCSVRHKLSAVVDDDPLNSKDIKISDEDGKETVDEPSGGRHGIVCHRKNKEVADEPTGNVSGQAININSCEPADSVSSESSGHFQELLAAGDGSHVMPLLLLSSHLHGMPEDCGDVVMEHQGSLAMPLQGHQNKSVQNMATRSALSKFRSSFDKHTRVPDTKGTTGSPQKQSLGPVLLSHTSHNFQASNCDNEHPTDGRLTKCSVGLQNNSCLFRNTGLGHTENNSVVQIDTDTEYHDESSPQTQGCNYMSSDAPCGSNNHDILTDSINDMLQQRRSVTFPFSMKWLRQRLAAGNWSVEQHSLKRAAREFRARIAPSENKAAVEELRKTLNKDSFANMQIIGQFNLGFVIASLGTELFIVDQHATDEKYNFEQLSKHTIIRSQKLIKPQDLELTVASECILEENLTVFNKNGFEFVKDETAVSGRGYKLSATPVSGYWTFGKEDVDELIFMLSDAPGVMCRPTRVSHMFASRACRKSIMIGTALSHSEMKKLVSHMGDMKQPWNCPHGRPTLRHLISLHALPD